MLMTLKIAIGMLTGAALSFAYYKFIGCASGACPLTSNPWISTMTGLMFGAMLTRNASRLAPPATQTESTKRE